MRQLLIGQDGQLGTELSMYLNELDLSFDGTTSKTLDITDRGKVHKLIQTMKPDVIYLCAAYTAVDRAENEGKELNWLVNVEGTKNVGEAAETVGATLVYLSTDYVFSWESSQPIPVDAPYQPLNEYGRAKQAAEEWILTHVPRHYIIRTSWVFGAYGHNFMKTMEQLAKTRDVLTVVNDQFGRPTWTRTLAEFMVYLVTESIDYGVYHLSNQGSCSWYEFASYILKNQSVEVLPVSSDEYPQQAKRPTYSILDLSQTIQVGYRPIHWQTAVDQLQNRNPIH